MNAPTPLTKQEALLQAAMAARQRVMDPNRPPAAASSRVMASSLATPIKEASALDHGQFSAVDGPPPSAKAGFSHLRRNRPGTASSSTPREPSVQSGHARDSSEVGDSAWGDQSAAQTAETQPASAAVATGAKTGGFSGLARGRISGDSDNQPAPAADERGSSEPVTARGGFAALAKMSAERRNHLQKQDQVRVRAEKTEVRPDPAWPHPEIPAGSAYSPQEWAAARAQGNVHVWEIRNAGESALMCVDRLPPPRVERQVVGGKVVETEVPYTDEEIAQGFDPMLAAVLDGCLVLAPSATTTHPNAAKGEINFSRVDEHLPGPFQYRLVRPEVEPEGRWMPATLKMRLHLGSQDMPPEEERERRFPSRPRG